MLDETSQGLKMEDAMKRRNIALRGAAIAMLAWFLSLMGASTGSAQTMDQYYAVPPFVSDQVLPNIILLLDNSGSMSGLACDRNDDGDCVDVADQVFTNTATYSGYFDSLTCYTYDTTDTRFEFSATKAALATACTTTQWDGNFLNWATFRRFDALKKAMIGGDCLVARAADGTCPTNGTPALKTVRAQAAGINTEMASIAYGGGAGVNTYVGRMPSADYGGTPGTLYIGTDAAYFCVDNDNTFNTNCGDSYSQRKYELKVGYSVEPTGVIQQIGAQARFGLFEFKPAGDGARMLVGVGARQSIDFGGGTVETFNTNVAAMVDAVQESFPSTWTPLSESLYETVRYVAQINSTYVPGSYVFPIAFSGGISNGGAFATNGVGSIGTSEISALTGTEVCPVGYIANACGRDPFFFGSNHTPPWASTSTQVTCCKTFVILVTDGEPTQDTNIPTGLRDYAHGQHGQHCVGGNATIHAPNGTCNTNQATPAATLLGEHKTDYANSGNHYLDDVAYWAHTNDLRPCSGAADGSIAVLGVTGHCLPGFQNVTLYTFFAFGNIAGREILMHAARLGGFEDTNGNNLPDVTSEWDKVINATGAPGTDGIPDNYFESSNVDDLQDRLMAAITAIIRKSASGTSISVLATSSTGEGSIYQAYFYTTDVGQAGANVKWTGYAHALFVDTYGNFREDTNQDGVLTYDIDRIVESQYINDPTSPNYQKVMVHKFVDMNSDGVADSATPVFTGELRTILPIWEAGKELALGTSASRKILTWVDPDNDGVVDAGEQIAFTPANCAALRDYLRYAGDACSGSSNAMNLINFIRGDEVTGLRTRMLEVPVGSGNFKVWRLGDPIHSTPTVVAAPKSRYDLAYGDSTYTAFYTKYRTRRQVVYVGANDGMLHAFNGGYYHKGDNPATGSTVEHGWYTKNPTDNSSGPNLGAELWSFIPHQLLPQLQWLARTDYTHVYYVDLKPTITEARVFTPDADHPGGWGTILIGGFRMGGSCGQCASGSGAAPMTATIGGVSRNFYSAYFALDVTNPEVDPKLLWVFTDSGLGLTTSYPAVARMNPTTNSSIDPTNEKWYVLFGSGPNGYQADLPSTPTQTASLYAVDLKFGPKVAVGGSLTTMPVGTYRSFMGHVVAVDKDGDWRTDVAYAARTLHDGSLPWRGKMYRLTMGCPTAPCVPTSWGVANGANRAPTEVLDTFWDATSYTTKEMGPTASSPVVAVDDADKVWVLFGTGRYFGNTDKVDSTIQRLFGIKDSVLSGTCTETSITSCYDDDLVDVTNAVICLICSGGTNQVTDPTNPGVTSFNGTGTTSMMGLVQSKDGWRVNLPGPVTLIDSVSGLATNYASERSVVNPTLIAGSIFFPTFAPTNNFCASDGISYLYVLYYRTGTASTVPVIGTTTSGGNTVVNGKFGSIDGLLSAVTIHCGQVCSAKGQSSTGAFTSTGLELEGNYSRFVNWIHQRD
ncbi:putative Type IV pilus assembly protein PilY1 [Nitrospira lenta]|uniref:Putative Type IV pilus assembly protein PilY1 n=2 Tax=Nitrospira lenta TaxID=1436998 RepID=A0A330L550_9BACT|nr:putative Type IV pilus assembly protein PilY1 [Nitrospira lenta]